MPTGDVHLYHWRKNIINARIAAVTLAAILIWADVQFFTMFTIFIGDLLGYEQFGKYIDPDDDQPSRTASEGRLIRSFGVIGIVFVAYKSLYSWAIYLIAYMTGTLNGKLGGHRTFWSHSYVFSTIFRMLFYFWLTFVIIWMYIEQPFYFWMFFVGVTIGLSKSDALHIFLDNQEGSAWKKLRKKLRM